MSELGNVIYRAISGRSPEARTRDPFATLERAAGGKAAAARLIGVHPATYRRWSNGRGRPSRHSADLMAAAIRRARLTPAREARLRRSGEAGIRISAWQGGRHRTIDGVGLDLRPGTIDALITAYLRGASPTILGRVFVAGIREPFYRRHLGGLRPEGACPAMSREPDFGGDDDLDPEIPDFDEMTDEEWEEWLASNDGEDWLEDWPDDPADAGDDGDYDFAGPIGFSFG